MVAGDHALGVSLLKRAIKLLDDLRVGMHGVASFIAAYVAHTACQERLYHAGAMFAHPCPGSGTFCSRTRPWATSFPSSRRVMVTLQSCCTRPWMIGSATIATLPSRIDRRKSVELLTPTANCPCSKTAADAPTLATLSISVV